MRPVGQGRSRLSMPVAEFHAKTRPDTIDSLLLDLASKSSKEEVAQRSGEIGSWRNSLPVIADQLYNADLTMPIVCLEFNPPHEKKRADVVIAGTKNNRPSVLVVELKQWSQATWNAETCRVEDFGAKYDSEHPVIQAKGYADMASHFISGFATDTGASVDYCAFLHNASKEQTDTLFTVKPKFADRLFLKPGSEPGRFRDFLVEHFDNVDGSSVGDELNLNCEKMSKDLLAEAGSIYSNPEAFPLSTEQRDVVSKIQNILQKAADPHADKDRSIIVVKGKPGSGKTFICVHLMARLAQAEKAIHLLTSSTSLRASLQKAAGTTTETRHLKAMIGSPLSFWDQTTWGTRDALIIDEAQRIHEWTIRTGHRNSKEVQAKLEEHSITQLLELTKAAKTVVLMMDELQQTTAKDFLTNAEIEKTAQRIGAELTFLELEEQHRNGGSKVFEEWVDKLVDDIPVPWTDEENFLVRVADSPEHMEELLRSYKNEEPRILAGFCWPWTQDGKTRIRKSKNHPGEKWNFKSYEDVPNDIKIGNWERKWNLSKQIAPYPHKDLWASDPNGAHQVGSIFTGQGFEFDYCGVIIGNDLVARGKDFPLEIQIEESANAELVKKAKSNPEFLQRFRNGYRVLLTRAKQGVVLYSTDPQTQELLKSIVNPIVAPTLLGSSEPGSEVL